MAKDDTDRAELAEAIGRLVSRIHQRVDARAFDVVVDAEFTLSQLRVLKLLSCLDEPRPISAIADELAMSLATAGRAVDHLVRHGLTDRWEDPTDRRSKLVRLTAAGRAMTEVPKAVVEQEIRAFADNLPLEVAGLLRQALTAALGPKESPRELVER